MVGGIMRGQNGVAGTKDDFMTESSRYMMHARMGLDGLFDIGLDELSPKSVEKLQSLCDELLQFLYPDKGELTEAPSSFALAVGMLEASRDMMRGASSEDRSDALLKRVGRVLSDLNTDLVLMDAESKNL